jgi:hypothetical protein
MPAKKSKSKSKSKRSSPKAKKATAEVMKYAKAYAREHPHAEWATALKHGGARYRKVHHSKK